MTTTAQLAGAAALGCSAVFLVGIAASLGAASAHQAADRRLEVEQREHHRARAGHHTPPPPAIAPTCHVRDETMPLTTVQSRRARHRRKGQQCT